MPSYEGFIGDRLIVNNYVLFFYLPISVTKQAEFY